MLVGDKPKRRISFQTNLISYYIYIWILRTMNSIFHENIILNYLLEILLKSDLLPNSAYDSWQMAANGEA